MSSNLELVKAWQAVPVSDVTGRSAFLSDDFQSLDENGEVIADKEAWDGMYYLLMNSFDDYDFVVTDYREIGDNVIFTGHFKGTFTSDLDMSAMGLGVIPATGKKVIWPEQSNKITIEDGKIVKLEPYGDSGGMEAFLEALGVTMPSG